MRERWNEGHPYSRISDRLIVEVKREMDSHFVRVDFINQLCQARDETSLLIIQARQGHDNIKNVFNTLPQNLRLDAATKLMDHCVFNKGG